LAGGKKVIIGSSRGGAYSTSEQMRALDFQEDYLKVVLGFVGVTDVTIIRAEGLALGAEARSKSMSDAQQEIGQLLLAA
jgi:FMN-dependent NADH-azoreductase